MRNPIKDKIASFVINDFPQLMLMVSGQDRRKFNVLVNRDYLELREKRGDRAIRIARSVAAHLPDMVRSFDYYFNSASSIAVGKRGRRKRVVDFSTPRFHEVSGFTDFPIMCPSMTEPYVTAQQYVDFADLREGDTVFDLGGYSGLTGIAFSKCVGPSGKVIVLEPDPNNFQAAKTNFEYHKRINCIDNVVLLPLAVSGNGEYIEFSAEGSMGSANAEFIGDFRGDTVRVESITLQGLANRFELDRINFIKMDIEGAEDGVVAESIDFFRKYSPKIIVEPHNVNGVSTEDSLKNMLSDIGYRCETIVQTGVTLPLVTGIPQNSGLRAN